MTSYGVQFLLQLTAQPPGELVGVSPGTQWVDNQTVVMISATNSTSWAFKEWNGTGQGSYSGWASHANVTVDFPISEVAVFEPVYACVFAETGLPTDAHWAIELAGNLLSGITRDLNTSLPNGTYEYAIASPVGTSYGVRYAALSPAGSIRVEGGGAVANVQYSIQFLINVTQEPDGSGTVNFSSGWLPNGTVLTMQATPRLGWGFVRWFTLQGNGYSGISDPTTFSVAGPVNETAIFSRAFALTIVVNPPSCGSILLNGTPDNSGSVVLLTPSTFDVEAPTCADERFEGWAGSGGVIVIAAGAQNTGLVFVGNGTISANYIARPFPELGVDLVLVSGLASAVGAAALVVVFNRKEPRAPPNRSRVSD